jgi:hypothetical protein
MASEWWTDIEARWKASRAQLYNITVCAFHHAIGSSGGAEAQGRLLKRKTISLIHRQWEFACGAQNLEPTFRDVSRFVMITYNIPITIPQKRSDDPMNWAILRMNWALRDTYFETVATVLIARGDATFDFLE